MASATLFSPDLQQQGMGAPQRKEPKSLPPLVNRRPRQGAAAGPQSVGQGSPRRTYNPNRSEQKGKRPSAAATLTPDSSRNSEHHNTCLELLINGNVDAFVELFELTSKDPDDNGIAEDTAKLRKMQAALGDRDVKWGADDKLGAYESMKQLADWFKELNDLAVARQFCLSALRCAKVVGAQEVVAEAHMNLGLVYEQQGKLHEAVAEMEMTREGLDGQDPNAIKEACENLAGLMIKLADQLEARKDWEGSLERLKGMMDFAIKAENPGQVAKCNFRLGNVYEKLGRAQEAIDSLVLFMDQSDHGNEEEHNYACSVLAKSYERLGDTVTAANYLVRLVETSIRAEQHQITSEAAARLGKLYGHTGELEKSVQWYTTAFEKSKLVDDLTWVTECQIELGTARAKAMTQGYQRCLTNNKITDVVRLLMWTSHREESFTTQSPIGGAAVAADAGGADGASPADAEGAAAGTDAGADAEAEADAEATPPPLGIPSTTAPAADDLFAGIVVDAGAAEGADAGADAPAESA